MKAIGPKAILASKGSVIIEAQELKGILDSLSECYELIEHNTSGLAVDEKDTARIYLTKWEYLKPIKPKAKKK